MALAEWVVARVGGHVDTKEALLRLEAAWLAVFNPTFTTTYDSQKEQALNKFAPSQEPIEFGGPLRTALKLVVFAQVDYLSGGSQGNVHSGCMAMSILVNDITEKFPAYVSWFRKSLKRVQEKFPNKDEALPNEPMVPREFFEPNFVWGKEPVEAAKERFMKSVDVNNPYV